MSSGLFASIIVIGALILFLYWRSRIARRINNDEIDFIKDYTTKYAILIFQGVFFEIQNTENQIEPFAKTECLYGMYTYAIPEGVYETIVSFDFHYGNGSKLGGRSSTPLIRKTLNLKQGKIYRYRLKDQPFAKKYVNKIIFEETVISRPTDVKNSFTHTVIFEELMPK